MNWLSRRPKIKMHAKVTKPVSDQDLRCKISCAGLTDVGRERRFNQDHFLIADLHKNMHVCQSSVQFDAPELFGDAMGKLLFVADGVGGSKAGDVASQMAIQEMSEHLLNSMHWLFCPTDSEVERFVDDLKSGAWRSHAALVSDSDNNPDHRGMGSTLTVAYIFWPMLYVVHVGDSRCYIHRNGRLQRLTKDQTLAQLLFDGGQLTESEFKDCPYHHILVSVIGGEHCPDAVVYKTQLKPDDRVLLCSDGVSGELQDEEIETIVGRASSPNSVCADLIDTANQRGGSDNITAVVAFCDAIKN